jgi:membrane protease YdiL (CAAX protease family)
VDRFKIAAGLYVITLAAYAVVLYYFPQLDLWIPSYIFHVIILVFPMVLVANHQESLHSLGLVPGKWKSGILSAIAVYALALLIYWFFYQSFNLPTVNHQLIAAVVWGPVAEELFFRGYMQPKLEEGEGKWTGLILSALLFGISHAPRIFLRQAAPVWLIPEAFVIGVVFGIIRDRTGSIFYTSLAHAGYNLIVSSL